MNASINLSIHIVTCIIRNTIAEEMMEKKKIKKILIHNTSKKEVEYKMKIVKYKRRDGQRKEGRRM